MKKKINIAHLHWGFPPIIGGVETHLTVLLPQLVKIGHKVSLLTGAVEEVPGCYQYEGVEICRTPIMDLNWLAKRGMSGLIDEVRRVFKDFFDKVKPDVIHAHNMHYFSQVHAQVLEEFSLKLSAPLILTAHNVWDDVLFLELTRRIKWTHIIAVSHFIKKELIGIGYDDKKITVVHHGIDEEKYRPDVSTEGIFKKYPQLKNKRVIFHPARMGLAKGCDVSIKALNVIKETFPDCLLVLAGTKNIIDWALTQQKDIAYIVNLVNFFKLKENVLIDAYPLKIMPALYAVSEVCVYPSSSPEPFGMTMLEAMASCRPIVVTKTGGMPEVVENDINGYVVPVKDYSELASRVIQLLSSKRLRQRLGYTGRQMLEQSYTKRMVAQNTFGVYKKFV
jgi:hypothetical protein